MNEFLIIVLLFVLTAVAYGIAMIWADWNGKPKTRNPEAGVTDFKFPKNYGRS